jgi:histidinol-phosphatase (PHP family)
LTATAPPEDRSMPAVPRETLHCHTCFSDGAATPAELALAAAAAGFRRLGISDHLVLHPDLAEVSWSMRPDQLGGYVAAVRDAGAAAGIAVRVGLEVDFFPDRGWRDRLAAALAGHAIDYLIGSIHYLGDFNLDAQAADWQGSSATLIADRHAAYWEQVAAMATAGGWAFLGHLDLPKKFGFVPAHPPRARIDAALTAIAAAGIPIELNTGGWDKPCAECYPGPDLLRRCREAGIAVLVNDDAHAPADLGRHYDRAAAALAAAGCTACATAVP